MDYIIIVAGGKGTRMGTDVPKQFLPIGGKPVLMHTIERFHNYDPALGIIVVLPKDQQATWQSLCEKHGFTVPHSVADGGATRFESSKNGLSFIPDSEEGVVGFHDGVRPFVSNEVIDNCYETAREEYSAVPVVPVTDTLRHVDSRTTRTFTVDRSLFRAVQTPQVFDIGLAKQAFNQPDRKTFTDDASVVESLGVSINTVEGNKENIKITTPFDLKVAEVLIESNH
jgi:2-C-methyl-D-erythritol 4-phosphate cytidylyltransferase